MHALHSTNNYFPKAILFDYNIEDLAGNVKRIGVGMMPTSKRKVNDKRWKQPKMFDKLPNGLLGFKLLSQKFSVRLSFHSFCHKLYNVRFAPHKHSAKNRA